MKAYCSSDFRKCSVFRFQSYLRCRLPGISLSREVPSLYGVRYLLLFVTTFCLRSLFFSIKSLVSKQFRLDNTIVGFFSFVKDFLNFSPFFASLPDIIYTAQSQSTGKLFLYLMFPVRRIFHFPGSFSKNLYSLLPGIHVKIVI